MRVEELDYSLPRELIADRPAEPRDACRLMVIHRATGGVEHRRFRDLSAYLRAHDLLVLNSARVTPARLFATVEGGGDRRFEILVIDAGDSARCRALVYPSRAMAPGNRLRGVETGGAFRVLAAAQDGQWELELENEDGGWRRLLESEGHMPLPPYILKRRAHPTDMPEDRVWYQTAFADRDGAIAAPTAGLHFSHAMLQAIEGMKVELARLFLKVGIGTFQPVRTATLEEHRLLPEEYEFGLEVEAKIRAARSKRGRVIGVGTTVARTLEFCADGEGGVRSGKGVTNLFITPPYSFRVIDALVTNFHLPKTTLLALVYAFGGASLVREAYEEAVREKYRFFSYGDAMLIL